MTNIPNIVHFVYIKERPWKLHHYLAVKSALVKAKADSVKIWLDEEPDGEWWDKTKPLVTVNKVKAPTEIFGKPITQPAHKSDVIRLQVLIQEGGIYADTDSTFAKTWLAGFKDTFGGGPPGSPTWCTHSVNLPAYLANTMQETITLADHEAFFLPLYHQDHIEMLFEKDMHFPNAFSHHLWESSGKKYLDEMTIEKIKNENTTFTRLVKDLI